jgi:hypothetical protein
VLTGIPVANILVVLTKVFVSIDPLRWLFFHAAMASSSCSEHRQ